MDSSNTGLDLVSLATSKSNRFAIRYAFVVLGSVWFTVGASIASSMIVTREPPKFPICSSRLLTGNDEQMLQACDPDVPLSHEAICFPGRKSRYVKPGISVVSEFDLPPSFCTKNPFASIVMLRSFMFLSMGIGALIVTPYGDKLGRKSLITLGAVGLLLSQIAASFSASFLFYSLSTAAAGVFLVMMMVPVSVTAAELTQTWNRQYLTLSQVLWLTLGGLYTAIANIYIDNWRTITLLTGLPCIFYVNGCMWMSGLYVESPKWLACRGRMDEAYDIWVKIAQYNRVNKMDLPSPEEFIKTEVETIRATTINSWEELDEELSMMSVQYLAAPDSVFKACSCFPTSVWLGVLSLVWVASGGVYSGIWRTRYDSMVNQLYQDKVTISPRLLQQARIVPVQPLLSENKANNTYQSEHFGPLPVIESNSNVPPSIIISESKSNMPVENGMSKLDLTDNNNLTSNEYFDLFNEYLKNGGLFLLNHAKDFPQKAEEFYDEYELDRMVQEMKHDFEPETLNSNHPILQYRDKSRFTTVFTILTYSLDFPTALVIIGISGREWSGRKGAILSFSIASGTIMVLAAITSLMKTDSIISLSLAVSGRCLLSAVFQLLFIYTAECVPTSVRCGCVGLMLSAAFIAAGFAIPFSDILDMQFCETTVFILGVLAILGGSLGTTALPDTLGIPLCDTLEIQEVLYENMGYHKVFFGKRMHRIAAFICHGLCRTRRWNRTDIERTASATFEARGRNWLKNKLKNDSRKRKQHFPTADSEITIDVNNADTEHRTSSEETHY